MVTLVSEALRHPQKPPTLAISGYAPEYCEERSSANCCVSIFTCLSSCMHHKLERWSLGVKDLFGQIRRDGPKAPPECDLLKQIPDE